MKKGLLIIFSGPSGVGKGTIRKEIIDKEELKLAYSVSMTTRARRNKEVEGVDYFYVSKEKFDEVLASGGFLEHCEFVGNKYGTPIAAIEEQRNKGINVLLEIEIVGAKQVMEKLKNDDRVLSIFLLPPSLEELESRIRKRKSEDDETIKLRLAKARSEMGEQINYDYVVVNDNLKRASEEISDIILKNMK